jgi:uncharacterized membrane protein
MNREFINRKNSKKLAIIITVAVTLILVAFAIRFSSSLNNKNVKDSGTNSKVVKDNDIVIQVKDVTDTPSFYPAQMNGTDMEVIAVKASDGTIRTVFNTCQVCYSSGKGYYKYEDGKLVCQNCGNSFGMDDVEVTKGGCNPVPITKEYKTVTDSSITISKDVLTQALVIFDNWK